MDKAATYLVGLSGPPRSGKDTLGNLLAALIRDRGIPVEVHALSMPMRLAVYGMLGGEYSPAHYEAHKDKPFPTENGRTTTIRQEMIDLSEHHVKPRLGHGWWAWAMLNRTKLAFGGVIIVTDMGFPAEHDVFVEELGASNCAWFHIHRTGHDFSKDSRGYVGAGSRVYNDGTPATEATRMLGRLLNQHGWRL